MAWIQLPVWLDYLCIRIISGMRFEINIWDWREGSTVSSVICKRCWHLNLLSLKCHRGLGL